MRSDRKGKPWLYFSSLRSEKLPSRTSERTALVFEVSTFWMHKHETITVSILHSSVFELSSDPASDPDTSQCAWISISLTLSVSRSLARYAVYILCNMKLFASTRLRLNEDSYTGYNTHTELIHIYLLWLLLLLWYCHYAFTYRFLFSLSKTFLTRSLTRSFARFFHTLTHMHTRRLYAR